MTADVRAHCERPWRVHTLAPDFELLDLWTIALDADPTRGETFGDFLRVFTTAGANHWPVYSLRPTSLADVLHAARIVGAVALLELRRWLGRVLALDADRNLKIPGRNEIRVRARLTDDDRGRDLGTFPAMVGGAFEPVYAFADEALLEIANRTIHALLHLSWVETAAGRRGVVLAVYVKSRGWQSRAYMALIRPFRHAIVYPAWLAHLTRTWNVLRPQARAAEG